MDKNQAADALDEMAELLELKGENPFKTRAYTNGARALRSLDDDLATLVAEGRLKEIKGFGDSLIAKVTELFDTGKIAALEELRGTVPPGLAQMMRIPGLGPKRVQEIHKVLGVSTLDELEAAAKADRLADLPGMGAKSQAKILAGIEQVRLHGSRFRIDVAEAEGTRVLDALRAVDGIVRMELAGSVRRRRETIGDLDIVASTTKPAALMDAFVALPAVRDVLSHGETRSSVVLRSGIQVDLRAVKDGDYAATLLYFTGSKEHQVALRTRAQKMGLKLNEYGLFHDDEREVKAKDEKALYAALDLAWIPPEMREDRGEIEAAAKHGLPELLEEKDIRGVLHCHSVDSDGANTLREMALAAKAAGYSYIGMSDHSQSARYANGMLPDTVKRQHEDIDRLNEELEGITILKGSEVDILADGELDYSDAILSSLDFVIGSVHSRFNMERDAMTARMIAAIENPHLDVVGHLTGRLLLAREPYALDTAAVLDAAVKHGVAVEINANPRRLDLDWREVHAFLKKGGLTSINPDAHVTDGILDVRYGVGIARKGWATKASVLNARPLPELRKWLSRRRKRRT